MSVSHEYREVSITEADTFTEPLPLGAGDRASLTVDIGTSTTVTVQRRFDNGVVKSAWYDVESYASDLGLTYEADEHQEIRLGVKSGNYGSGTTTARIGAG